MGLFGEQNVTNHMDVTITPVVEFQPAKNVHRFKTLNDLYVLGIQSFCVGQYSVDIMATRYMLEGPRIESLFWRDFPHPSRPALGPTEPLVQWVPGRSRG
jgi:hypothetical protein